MPQAAAETPMLSYAVKPRRRWRRYVLGFGVIVLVGAGVYWRTILTNRITHLYWQHRVETFEYPKGTVVWEAHCCADSRPQGWETVQELLRSQGFEPVKVFHLGSYLNSGKGWEAAERIVPQVENYLHGASVHHWNAGLAFVGLRVSHGGFRGVILVRPEFALDGSSLLLRYVALGTVSPIRDEQASSSKFDYFAIDPTLIPDLPQGFRAFGGQRDPADASRFTIDYETATEKGTIVGVLQDDGSVVFSILKR
jgi:hypothetical protein